MLTALNIPSARGGHRAGQARPSAATDGRRSRRRASLLSKGMVSYVFMVCIHGVCNENHPCMAEYFKYWISQHTSATEQSSQYAWQAELMLLSQAGPQRLREHWHARTPQILG